MPCNSKQLLSLKILKTKANQLFEIQNWIIDLLLFHFFLFTFCILKYNVFEVKIWKLENLVKMKCFFFRTWFFFFKFEDLFLNLNILIQSKACEACIDLLGQFRKACEACSELHAQQCAYRVFKCVALWLEKLRCRIMWLRHFGRRIIRDKFGGECCFAYLRNAMVGKAVSNGVRAASLPNVNFPLRGRSPML